jgi:hypothetical protein
MIKYIPESSPTLNLVKISPIFCILFSFLFNSIDTFYKYVRKDVINSNANANNRMNNPNISEVLNKTIIIILDIFFISGLICVIGALSLCLSPNFPLKSKKNIILFYFILFSAQFIMFMFFLFIDFRRLI